MHRHRTYRAQDPNVERDRTRISSRCRTLSTTPSATTTPAQRAQNSPKCGTADGGGQDLIASRKPRAPIDQTGISTVTAANTPRRSRHITRFSTASVDSSRLPCGYRERLESARTASRGDPGEGLKTTQLGRPMPPARGSGVGTLATYDGEHFVPAAAVGILSGSHRPGPATAVASVSRPSRGVSAMGEERRFRPFAALNSSGGWDRCAVLPDR